MHKQMNVTLALLLMLGIGIASAAGQAIFNQYTAFALATPQATLPLTGTEAVLLMQGGTVKQVTVTNLRGASGLQVGSPFVTGNCVQASATTPPTVITSATGCVTVPTAPFLLAQ